MGWFLIAAIQIGFSLLSKLLRPHPKRPTAQALEGWFAEEGRPIPQIYGVQAVSPNIVWWGDGEVDEASDGGSPFYYANMIGTLCLGPALEIMDIQFGGKSLMLEPLTKQQSSSGTDEVVSPPMPATLVGDGPLTLDVHARQIFGGHAAEGGVEGQIRIYPGTRTQAVDPLTTRSMVGQAVPAGTARPGVVYMCFGQSPVVHQKFYWGAVAQPKEVVVVLRVIPRALYDLGLNAAYTNPAVGHDANAAEVIYDLITNPVRGQGTPAARVDAQSFANCAAVIQEEGNTGISLTVSSQDEIQDLIDEIKKHVDCEVYNHPTTGLITMALARPGDPVTRTITPANGVSFTPNSTGWRGLVNQVRLTYRRWAGGTSGPAITETITENFQFSQVLVKQFQVNGRNLSNVSVSLGVALLDPLAGDYTLSAATGTIVIYRTATTEAHLGDTLTVTYGSSPIAMHLREAVALADDVADQQTTGDIRSVTLDFPYYTKELNAYRRAAFMVRMLGLSLRSGTIDLDRAGYDLVPLERIRVIWPPYDLADAPFDYVFRVGEVFTGRLESGRIKAEVIQDVWSEDVIAQLPPASGDIGGVQLQAPAMAIGCGAGGTVVRLDLFPSDRTFSIEIWEADDELGTNAVLLDTIAGTELFYDAGTDDSKAHRARLVRVGWTEGPVTPWITCDLAGPPADPQCIPPTYVGIPDQVAGTLTLVITDLQHRVTRVEFRHRSGAGSFTAWITATTETDGSYLDTVTLSDSAASRIEWRITYLNCAGDDATFEGGADFSNAAPDPEPPPPVPDATGSGGQVVFHAEYLEAIDVVVPDEKTELSQIGRRRINLSGAARARSLWSIASAGPAGATIRPEYVPSTNETPAEEEWQALNLSGDGPISPVDATDEVPRATTSDFLALLARQDVIVRYVGEHGDGVTPFRLRSLILDHAGGFSTEQPPENPEGPGPTPCEESGGVVDGFEGYADDADLLTLYSLHDGSGAGATLTLQPTGGRIDDGQCAQVQVPIGATNAVSYRGERDLTGLTPGGAAVLTAYVQTDWPQGRPDPAFPGSFADGPVQLYLGQAGLPGGYITVNATIASEGAYELLTLSRSVDGAGTLGIGFGMGGGAGSMDATRTMLWDDFHLTVDGIDIPLCGGSAPGTPGEEEPPGPPSPPAPPATGIRALLLQGYDSRFWDDYPAFQGAVIHVEAGELIATLDEMRTRGWRMVLIPWTQNRIIVNGVFSPTAYLGQVNAYAGLDLSSYTDILAGIYVIDEPRHPTRYGPNGIQWAVVDGVLAKRCSEVFPGYPQFVRASATQIEAGRFRPQYISACWLQFLSNRAPTIQQYLATEGASAGRLGLGFMLGLNYRNGGTPVQTPMDAAEIRLSGIPEATYAQSYGVAVWTDIWNVAANADLRSAPIEAAFSDVAAAMIQP